MIYILFHEYYYLSIFKRSLESELFKWKNKPQRMPLILKGARQVGKTSLIQHFGKSFPNIHIFNFQRDKSLSQAFLNTNTPSEILQFLEVKSSKRINIKTDLIFFDEIQDCPEALNSLKFFSEEFPESYLVGAGSLLGVYFSHHTFPLGKVQFLNLYPFSFSEFLQSIGKEKLSERLTELDEKNNIYHIEFIKYLKLYFAVGGMPKAIEIYLEQNNLDDVRETQRGLLTICRADFAKYSG